MNDEGAARIVHPAEVHNRKMCGTLIIQDICIIQRSF